MNILPLYVYIFFTAHLAQPKEAPLRSPNGGILAEPGDSFRPRMRLAPSGGLERERVKSRMTIEDNNTFQQQ